ncbi:MAG: alcohol dehydrogenase catalytic domain-containing protein [Actinomycetia bacterium]|nr:alcohol dehydrogenase catalytic domain-containing protein [Actinomycetes bacterium]
MRAVLLSEVGRVELADLPVPEPGPGEVRVEVRASGICGTDLSIVHGSFPARLPLVIGHEFSGVVDAVGSAVEGWRPGDRVAADPNRYDGSCHWCQQGAYNLCQSWQAAGITLPGALAQYLCVPARFLVPLPDEVSFTAGALIEPLSCAIHAFDRGQVTGPGEMLMYGAGTMGAACLVLARDLGLEVTVVETTPERRDRALALGAARVVEPGADLDQYDYVLDATGALAAINDGLKRVRTRGTFLQVGAAPSGALAQLESYDVFARELTIVGSFSVANAYPAAAARMPQLATTLEQLVTHRFRLDEFGAAVAAMAEPGTGKIHFDPTMERTLS